MMGIRSGCGWGKEGRVREQGDMGCGDLTGMDSGVVGCREVGWERASGVPHPNMGMGRDMDSLVAMCLVRSR